MIGPYLFEGSTNGDISRGMLEDHLPNLTENLPVHTKGYITNMMERLPTTTIKAFELMALKEMDRKKQTYSVSSKVPRPQAHRFVS